MTDLANPKDVTSLLEDIVDRYGLMVVCDMLGGICGAKAEHLLANWQDKSAATAWERAGRKFHAMEVVLRDFEIARSRTQAQRKQEKDND